MDDTYKQSTKSVSASLGGSYPSRFDPSGRSESPLSGNRVLGLLLVAVWQALNALETMLVLCILVLDTMLPPVLSDVAPLTIRCGTILPIGLDCGSCWLCSSCSRRGKL